MKKNQQVLAGVASIAIVAYLYLRSKSKNTTSTASTSSVTPSNSSATGSITPYTPQTPVVLQAGESVYDPNSEALLNAPAASTPATTGSTTSNNYPTGVSTTNARSHTSRRRTST